MPLDPDVTVVVPTRDRRVWLLRALTGVLAQRDVALEVVVVDEGSSDGTAEAVAALGDPRVRLVRHDVAQGVARARNAGLAVARGRWTAFTDDDDLWSPDKLRAQLDALAGVPGARWSCVGAVWLHDEDLRLGRPEHPPVSGDHGAGLLAGNLVPGGASGVLAETALLRELGGFDPGLSTMADWDLWTRLALAAPVATVDRPLLGYFIHTASMAHDVKRQERELEVLRHKHAGERGRRGVTLDEANLLWYFGAWYLRQGDRRSATASHWRLARLGTDRPLRAATAAALGYLWPGVQKLRDRHGERGLTPAWRAEAETWITPFRQPAAEQALVLSGASGG